MSPLPLLLDDSAVTDGLIAMLGAASGFGVGDNHAPDPPPGQETPVMPYLIVQRIDGGGHVERDMADQKPSRLLVYQVDAVSTQRDAAEYAAAVAYAVVLSRQASGAYLYPLVCPTGWRNTNRDLNAQGGAPYEGPLVGVANRYGFWIDPT